MQNYNKLKIFILDFNLCKEVMNKKLYYIHTNSTSNWAKFCIYKCWKYILVKYTINYRDDLPQF